MTFSCGFFNNDKIQCFHSLHYIFTTDLQKIEELSFPVLTIYQTYFKTIFKRIKGPKRNRNRYLHIEKSTQNPSLIASLVRHRDGKRIEFRDADNLRVTLRTYRPKVRPGCLAVAPKSLLFYNEVPGVTL